MTEIIDQQPKEELKPQKAIHLKSPNLEMIFLGQDEHIEIHVKKFIKMKHTLDKIKISYEQWVDINRVIFKPGSTAVMPLQTKEEGQVKTILKDNKPIILNPKD